jgi:hypothetical protein
MYTTGADGTFNLMINGEMVGTIPFKNTPTTTTIPNINISGPITISITDNSTSGNSKVTRVSFDDLSWTCYTTPLSTTEVETPKLSIYPNPVKNNTLYVTGKNIAKIKRLEIYNVNGILVQVADKPFNNKNYLVLKNLPKGIYFAKFDDNAQKFLVE